MLYDGQLDEAVIYQIKIHIIRSKVFQRLFKCWSYVIWIMFCILEFARDLSSHILFSYLSKRSIPKWFLRIVPSVECQMLDSSTDGNFVLIHRSAIHVTISNLKR
jgi:hypothetical protein